MNYPQMRSNSKRSCNIYDFSGGINTSKSPLQIQDNQAVSIKNMWHKDGTLQTRPAFKNTSSIRFDYYAEASKRYLRDLETEIDYSVEIYPTSDTSDAENKGSLIQKKYRLFFCASDLWLLDVETKQFKAVAVRSEDEYLLNILKRTGFNMNYLDGIFFCSNGIKEMALENGRVLYEDVRGYITFSACTFTHNEKTYTNEKIKLLLNLEPEIDNNGNVILVFKVTNAADSTAKNIEPYIPTIALDYGTAYAESLEDFNLLNKNFKVQYQISKAVADMETKVQRVRSNKGFADGHEDYGNFNAWDEVDLTIPDIANTSIDKITLYGLYKFKYYETHKFLPSELEESAIPVSLGGVYVKNEGTDKWADTPLITATNATAVKIELTPPDNNASEWICRYFDEHDNEVDITAGTNGIICTGQPKAFVSKENLNFWFPANECKVFVPINPEHKLSGAEMVEKTCNTAEMYVEQIIVDAHTNYSGKVAWQNQDQSELITRNTLKIWYGGTNGGLKDGTRLFVAGHPEHKNVLRWSGMNDVTYFPENNYLYIGKDTEPITAIGKQSGDLIVFKPNECYALTYTYTQNSNGDALVYFPTEIVSPYVGCDCPNTVQFVANRLTWLTSEGKVYTLYSKTLYNERNVREISQHIENELKSYTKAELQNAKAVSYDGNYILIVGNKFYIWDFDLNPLYNYTSSERSQKLLSWFEWECNFDSCVALSNYGAIDIVAYKPVAGGGLIVPQGVNDDDYVITPLPRGGLPNQERASLDGETSLDPGEDNESDGPTLPDEEPSYSQYEIFTLSENPEDILIEKPQSEFKSKLFDFGVPFNQKKIEKLFLRAECEGDFEVGFYNDDGEVSKSDVMSDGGKTTSYSINSQVKRTLSLGFIVRTQSPLKLISANITAEIYGEVK